MKIVILGLSVTSSWGNGHATTFRALIRELAARGHDVVFLERNVPWYAENRDLRPGELDARVVLYESLEDLAGYAALVASADATIVGSYVPEGIAACEWVLGCAQGVKAFYDIDTPVTLARMAAGDCEYLSPALVPRFDLFLSFAGGRTLERLEREYGSPCARAFYCSVDPAGYYPEEHPETWDLGYLGTYSEDRQPGLNRLLLEPAKEWKAGRFVVAGPQYPKETAWPDNVRRIEHLPPAAHREFYNSQRFTLNITRADMIAAGHSPSVRLFEAAACGTPVISDWWDGLDEIFAIGKEILVARDGAEALRYLREIPQEESRAIGEAAMRRVLGEHTASHRAAQLEAYLQEISAMVGVSV
jgi:spore maturation protein CgeB